MKVWKMLFLFKWVIFRFILVFWGVYVNIGSWTPQGSVVKIPKNLWNHHLVEVKARPPGRSQRSSVFWKITSSEKRWVFIGFLAPKKMLLWLVSKMTTTHKLYPWLPCKIPVLKLMKSGHFGQLLMPKFPVSPMISKQNPPCFFC